MKKKPAEVIFVDDSEDLRELMPVLLSTALGVECICFSSLTELKNHAEEALQARVAILDINLGAAAPDGVDALSWLKTHGFKGKIVFFTGHARTSPHVEQAEKSGVEILEKPLHADKLISFVERAMNGNR
jgi:FixJ family two-component response regulator